MFQWLRKVFRGVKDEQQDEREQSEQAKALELILRMLGSRSEQVEQVIVGKILCSSGSLTFADPSTLSGCDIEQIPVGNHTLSVRSREGRVLKMWIEFEKGEVEREEVLGDVPVDMARVVVVDTDGFQKFWDHEGPLREGWLVGGKELLQSVVLQLKRDFNLDFSPKSENRWVCLQPVPRELEWKLDDYLRQVMEGNRGYCRLDVRTDSTSERVIDAGGDWGEVVLDAATGTNAIVVHSGYGDGCYDVVGKFQGSRLLSVSIEFIPEEESSATDS